MALEEKIIVGVQHHAGVEDVVIRNCLHVNTWARHGSRVTLWGEILGCTRLPSHLSRKISGVVRKCFSRP